MKIRSSLIRDSLNEAGETPRSPMVVLKSSIFLTVFIIVTSCFPQQQHRRMRQGQNSYWTSSARSYGNGTERNDCVPFNFSYHLFHRSTFWNGKMSFEAFPCEHNLWALRFSERRRTERNDCVPVWTGPKSSRKIRKLNAL